MSIVEVLTTFVKSYDSIHEYNDLSIKKTIDNYLFELISYIYNECWIKFGMYS